MKPSKGQQSLRVESFRDIESAWKQVAVNHRKKYLSKPTDDSPAELTVVSMSNATRVVLVNESTMEIIKAAGPAKRMTPLTLQDTLKLH